MKIAVIGNGRKSKHEIYTRVPAAIDASAQALGVSVELKFVTTNQLIEPAFSLSSIDGIFAMPTPFENLQGFYNSLKFARENNIPWLGACGATQHAWVEFAITECGITDAFHIEQDLEQGTAVVDYLPDHYRVSNDGPLNFFSIHLKDGHNKFIHYSQKSSMEPFFANYCVKKDFREKLAEAGLKTIATFEDGKTPCLFELKNHVYFVGALFQPQMAAGPGQPHPLITALLKACQN